MPSQISDADYPAKARESLSHRRPFAQASATPTGHRFRFDDLQRVENIGSQRVYPGKHQPVDAGECQTARGSLLWLS
jgi:hypothetical protein